MQTYQLFIHLDKDIKIQVGKLGAFRFPAGDYVYTGSAKKNIEARIRRKRLNQAVIPILTSWRRLFSRIQLRRKL